MSEIKRRWIDRLPQGRTYPAGAQLLRQGATPRDVFLIEDGIVKLAHLDSQGEETIFGLRFPGWVVGAEAAIVGEPVPISASTLTPCRLCQVARETFVQLLKTDGDLSWRVSQMHSREVFDQLRRGSQPPGISSCHRLKELLRQLIEANETTHMRKEVYLHLALSRNQLAQLLAVTPRHLGRLLKQLQKESYLRLVKNGIIISDLKKLKMTHQTDVGWPLNRVDDQFCSALDSGNLDIQV